MRGIDMTNGAYQFLDLVPKGRHEDGFDFTMEWVEPGLGRLPNTMTANENLLSWHTILLGVIAAITLPILRKELRLCESIVHHRRP
jgi:hypothetical protein